jgi:hypothetical protein
MFQNLFSSFACNLIKGRYIGGMSNSNLTELKQTFYSLELSEGEASAIGYAIMKAKRDLKHTVEKDDYLTLDLINRLSDAYRKLDTCKIISK